jgi:FKBP-type peptidyl-prolyl cis-trans isomerase FkpA
MFTQAIRMVCVLLAVGVMAGCGQSAADREAAMKRAVELSAGITALGIEDVKVGAGAEATPGRRITVHYTGTLMDGTKVDSSRDRNEPYPFVLGDGAVIPGWDEGLKGMKVGGLRRLTIPPSMAYGARGSGAVPPNAALKFEVELMGVE